MKIAVQLLALLVIAVLPMPLHAAPDVLGLEPESLNALELESFEPWPESVGKTTAVSGRSENTVGSRTGAVARKVLVLSVSRVSPFVPV